MNVILLLASSAQPAALGQILRIGERLAENVAPALLIGAVATTYLGLGYLRRHRSTLLALILGLVGIYVALLLLLPGGRATVAAASHLSWTDRPICLIDATRTGALWKTSQLTNVASCKVAAAVPPPVVNVTPTTARHAAAKPPRRTHSK